MASNRGSSLRFPYVLFDLGSTLIYFDSVWTEVMARAVEKATSHLRSLGYDLDQDAFPTAYYELIQAYYHKRSDKWVEYTSEHVLQETLRAHSYPQPPTEHLRQALKVLYGVTQQHWLVEQDAAPTLEALLASGHRLGIISNASDDEDVQTLVDNAGLRQYFEFVLTSARSGMRKPSPAIFEEALSFWGAAPDQAVMVGDTVSADVAGANAIGMASVWILRRADTPENRKAAKEHVPGAVIYALSELPDLLERWPDHKS